MGQSQSTTVQKIPKWQEDFLRGTVLPAAERIAGADVTPYGGQFVPGISGYTTSAGQTYGNIAGMTPEQYAAQTQANFNPYQQNVIDASLAQMEREKAKALTGLEAQIIGSGAFGSRGEVARGEFEAANQAQRDALIANLMQQGYGQAQGLTQQQIANQIGAAGGLGQVGSAETALGAQEAASRYQEFLRQQNYPYQQLSGLLGAGQGSYGQTASQTYKPGLFDYLSAAAGAVGSYMGGR